MEITKYDRIQTAKDDDLILVTNDLDGTRTIRHDDLMRETTQIKDDLTVRDGISFHFDYQDGKYGFNTDPNRGADTFVPFISDDPEKYREALYEALQNSGLVTEGMTFDEMVEVLRNRYGSFDVFRVVTTSTGSNNASVAIYKAISSSQDKISNFRDAVQLVNLSYKTGSYSYGNLVISYGTPTWTLKITADYYFVSPASANGVYRVANSTYTWSYTSSIDYYFILVK